MTSKESSLLALLNIQPSAQSSDFVRNKIQFQLHGLLTEQRHPRTWNLSASVRKSIEEGLDQILSVDEDITQRLNQISQDPSNLEQAVEAVRQAIHESRKIYVYGCGATGRLAKQMESVIWRPFWNKINSSQLWDKLKKVIPDDIDDIIFRNAFAG